MEPLSPWNDPSEPNLAQRTTERMKSSREAKDAEPAEINPMRSRGGGWLSERS